MYSLPSRRRSQRASLFHLVVPSPALLEDRFAALGQDPELTGLDALQPVAEAATDSGEQRVHPEGFFGEDGTHLDAELPKTDGDA